MQENFVNTRKAPGSEHFDDDWEEGTVY